MVVILFIAIFKYNGTFKKTFFPKNDSMVLIFTLAYSDFFLNFETFFFKVPLLLKIAISAR